jgi:GTPase
VVSHRERALLVGLELKGPKSRSAPAAAQDVLGFDFDAEESLEELTVLAQSAGAEVTGRVLQARAAPEAATLIGKGKVRELADEVKADSIDVVIFDRELTPTQQRNLERAWGVKVLDRTQLILDIFAGRARTREGQMQVELAQLNYLLPRLAGRGVEMSRLGGGIGTRGPGETQLETDRRRINRRIRKIEADLESVRSSRGVQRAQRRAVPLATAALVGYTNAGKSTLFNRLTGAGVEADARMFATLDPTVRSITLPSHRRILLSDTVGFIRNLPTTLVRAFRATLEEVTQAVLILHLVDASSSEAAQHTRRVLEVLNEIGAGETRQLLVLNKVDLLPDASALDIDTLRARVLGEIAETAHVRSVAISARTGEGMDRLLATIDEILPFDPVTALTFRFPAGNQSKLHLLHEYGKVTGTRYDGEAVEVEAEVSESLRRQLEPFVVEPA